MIALSWEPNLEMHPRSFGVASKVVKMAWVAPAPYHPGCLGALSANFLVNRYLYTQVRWGNVHGRMIRSLSWSPSTKRVAALRAVARGKDRGARGPQVLVYSAEYARRVRVRCSTTALTTIGLLRLHEDAGRVQVRPSSRSHAVAEVHAVVKRTFLGRLSAKTSSAIIIWAIPCMRRKGVGLKDEIFSGTIEDIKTRRTGNPDEKKLWM